MYFYFWSQIAEQKDELKKKESELRALQEKYKMYDTIIVQQQQAANVSQNLHFM